MAYTCLLDNWIASYSRNNLEKCHFKVGIKKFQKEKEGKDRTYGKTTLQKKVEISHWTRNMRFSC